jgi:hypothetical protein
MKKSLVLTITGLVIGFLFVASIFMQNMRAVMGSSADALSGDANLERKSLRGFAQNAPASAAPESPKPSKTGRKQEMFAKEAEGGGGLGGLALDSAAPAPVVAGKMKKGAAAEPQEDEAGPSGGGAPTRAWFPETFLFEPLVVTDAQGHATVPVKVPDRLTTWRVLGLAHSRQGGQAGALTSFLGTLPTYVEPVTPKFLYAGDSVRLPIQVVNTTDGELSSALTVTATGGTLSGATSGTVKVPAGGNVVQYATLTTKSPGTATLHAALGSTDAVEKHFPVEPAGLRTVQARGGTLAAPRTFSLSGPADTIAGTEGLRLRVMPGALGLIRSELSAAVGRGGVAEDAYLLELLGEAPALLRSLGGDVEPATIRELSLLATQRVMRHARSPSVDSATLLTDAALSHPESPVLLRLGERLAMQVAQAQRPDGTCQGANGWTLQRLLVTTADCVHTTSAAASTSPVAKQRATVMSVKASGAFERNLARVGDGYTAAAILASGAVQGTVAEQLKKLVLEHLLPADDGSKYLEVGQGVVRADARVPSTYEATALAILALGDDPVVADLGSFLMSGYSASWGWGDGRANLVCLRAAVKLFKAPVPAGVKIVVSRDGKAVTEGTLDAAALKDVLTLDADAAGSVGAHEWTITATPAVPGLAYSFQLVSFTPWKATESGGLSLKVGQPAKFEVGKTATLALTAALPAGTAVTLTLPLPAGVQHDTTSLDGLVSAGKVTRYETQDGRITLHLPPQVAGALYAANLQVVPTLAGSLQSGPPTLMPDGRPQQLKAFAPTTWEVK